MTYFYGAPERRYLMADVFDGKPDKRQTDAEVTAPQHTLFRKRYRKLSKEELQLHDKIKDAADELAGLIGSLNPTVAQRLGVHNVTDSGLTCGAGNVTLAIRHLEDAVYRAVKALTA